MAKKVVINQDTCIGCNTCPLIDPETFALDPDSYKAKVIKQPESVTDIITTAITSCPVGAISLEDENL